MIDDIGVERRRLLGLKTNTDLFVPRINFKAAKLIYDQQGLEAWGVYRNGSYQNYFDTVMSDEMFVNGYRRMSHHRLWAFAAVNVAAQIDPEGDLLIDFSAQDISPLLSLSGLRSDGLIRRKPLKSFARDVWTDFMGHRDDPINHSDFTISFFLDMVSSVETKDQPKGRIKDFVRRDGQFRISFDSIAQVLPGLNHRLFVENELRGRALFMMDADDNACENLYSISTSLASP
jgi:hypothetical protein